MQCAPTNFIRVNLWITLSPLLLTTKMRKKSEKSEKSEKSNERDSMKLEVAENKGAGLPLLRQRGQRRGGIG